MTSRDIELQSDRIQTLGLLLIDGFALMSYASVVEPFRAANSLADRLLYRWRHVSTGGRVATASNGASILADSDVGEDLPCDMLFVFAAGDPVRFNDARTFAWLRHMATRDVQIAGVSGGPFLLAQAGLLDGYRSTIHWQHQEAYRAAFPRLVVETGLYVIDRRRMTCAGGTAGLDLALQLVERDRGQPLANRVSDWFIRTEPRFAQGPQRLSVRERFGVSDDRILKTLAAMEANIEEPHARSWLANLADLSVRQLERHFASHLGASVSQTYMRIRLDHAAHLLRTTSATMTDIALACGFASSSHFSRAFKDHFGRRPTQHRNRNVELAQSDHSRQLLLDHSRQAGPKDFAEGIA